MEKTSRLFVPFSIVKGDGADDGDQHMVAGIASSEAVDSDGEIISYDAIKAALAEYMKFANLREMHGMSAAGTVTKADPDDAQRVLHIEARVVDPTAWLKVKEGVYKGFSIGGKAMKRDGHTITQMKLSEISLVDRPANPDALIELYKADNVGKAKEPDVTENSIRVRVKNPSEFQAGSFRTIDISKPKGIQAVIGRPKGKESTEVQTYIFDKDKWSPAEAKKWVEDHEAGKSETKEAAVATNDIKKGMSTIGALAYHYDCLVQLEEFLEEEAEEEGEAPELAEMLAQVITQLGAVIVAGAEHEAAEHEAEEAEEAANKMEKNMAKKGISHKELCDAMKAIHEAYGQKMETFKGEYEDGHMHTEDEAEAHKAEVFSHPSMSVPDQKEEAAKDEAAKDEADKEEAKKAAKSDLRKALADIRKRLTPADHSAEIVETLAVMAERLSKMERSLQAPKAAARAIEKAEDGLPVAKADASDPKSLLMNIHKAGGFAAL